MEPAKADPAGPSICCCCPSEGTRFARRFKSINVWVDLKDHMPRRIETLDSNESTIRATDLSNVQVNTKLDRCGFRAAEDHAE